MSDLTCDACGAEVLDIDVRCSQCGHRLTSTASQRMLDAVVLGQYRVIDVLGQGGMSVVYKGKHELTDQLVALKILPPELAAHSQVKSRFLEEARALAQLDHPNIVHLYNFGQENGCFVLAMQFVEGKTFERMILEQQRLDWHEAVPVTIEVLKALEYAHTRGIVHRDMKPSNILIRAEDSTVTVMDFGIAKMTTSSRLTATGQTMGTVRYMSPEQVRGLEVDLRTDIYSLGASLYEAVVGDTPFDGDTHFEIMTKHLNQRPEPPSAHGIEVPRALEEVVLRALAKKPADRFQSARELRDALEAVLARHGEAAGDGAEAGRAVLAPFRVELAETQAQPEIGDITGLASQLEPTGSHEALSEVGPAVAAALPGRRHSAWWLGLASAVVLASAAVVAVIVFSKSEAAPVEVPDATVTEPVAAKPPTWPSPFLLSDVEFAVKKTYSEDQLRVWSVDPIDPEIVRKAYKSGHERFGAFLRERGLVDGHVPSQPMTVEVVPHDILCQARIYKEPEKMDAKAPADCAQRETWYRPREKTLFVVSDSRRLGINVAYSVAVAICLHTSPRLPGCDARLLDDFEARLSGSDLDGEPGSGGGKPGKGRKKRRGR